ncbi:MAG: amidohydrolase family protein [Candidatus Thorarchaeota archaeon]
MNESIFEYLSTLSDSWKYSGPIFDVHTHIGAPNDVEKLVKIEEEFGITAQVGIVHAPGFRNLEEQFPNRFVFAKYLSMSDVAQFNTNAIIEDISKIKEQGFSLAKMWFGPRWRDYVGEVPGGFRVDSPKLEPVFRALENEGIPLLLHVADPDTYFANQYKDSEKYGTKEEHLSQLESLISRHSRLKFQLAHMASQPEPHRLPTLARWLDRYPNVSLDTASSRWMARELSKDTEKSRAFMIKYADRVMFGTDISTNGGSYEYYSGRYTSQRILWETDRKEVPLPIPDPETKDSGGTFINGLDLPIAILRKIYWKNAREFYNLSS